MADTKFSALPAVVTPDLADIFAVEQSGVSKQVTLEQLFAGALVGGPVPVGGIIMWSGTIAAIPTPVWELCDGTANAPGPDLRDKFVVGATSDDAGVAKTNIRGSLEQSATATGHLHSAHANLTHAGGAVGDHTGLTHGLTIADHPDLTHAALSHPALTLTHADHSIPSASHTHAAVTLTHADHSQASQAVSMPGLTHADHSIASHANITVPSHSHATTVATIPTVNTGILTTATASTRATLPSSGANLSGVSFASIAGASIAAATYTHASHPTFSGTFPANTLTHADHSVASFSGTNAAQTFTHADHSLASLSHQAIGTHANLSHAFTAPAAHGAAGTLTHSFTQPSDHTISAHDTVSMVPSFFALAFIQRML